jgi:hypothetical protein
MDNDIQGQSDAESHVSAIFTDDGSESESSSDVELDSEDSDDSDDSDDEIYKDEGQLPPEHYLAEASGLDVSRLRQKRYSDNTQDALDGTLQYWNR